MSVKVKLDYAGFRAFRRSPEVKAALDAEAKAMAERANALKVSPEAHYLFVPAADTPEGSAALVSTGEPGKKTKVTAATAIDNQLHNTLARALGAS